MLFQKFTVMSRLGRIALAVAVVTASACGFAPAPVTGRAVSIQWDEVACNQASGSWQRLGMMGKWQCLLPMPDAGKACSSGAQCQSACLAPANSPADEPVIGVCAAVKPLYGCHASVENGRASPALCVD